MTHTSPLQVLPFLAAFFLAAAPALAADKLAPKRYALPEQHGSFNVSAPATWQDEVQQPPQQGLPPTILFTPATGKPFQVLLTPIWKPSPDVPTPSKDALRQRVERSAAELKGNGERVAGEIKVVEIQGKTGSGYYISATDKAPGPGEFKHLTQGLIMVSELMVTFSVLTNDGQQQVVRDALIMLRGAAHSPK
jgi:hypothetical protein